MAFYTLLQIVLWISTIVLNQGLLHYRYDIAVWAASFLLILGLATFFQFLIYGRRGLGKRVLCIFVVGALGILAFIVPILIVAALFEFIQGHNSEPVAAEVVALLTIEVTIMWASLGVLIFRLVRRLLKHGTELESQRWLEERRRLNNIAIRQRNRAIRFASWIPVSCVLIVFLFFPEVWALGSHRTARNSVLGYRVSIPATWLVWEDIQWRQDEVEPSTWTGETTNLGWWRANGLIFSGPAQALRRYWNLDTPISSWTLETLPYTATHNAERRGDPREDSRLLYRRTFLIGNERLTCDDYRPQWYERYYRSDDSAFVYCTGSGRLRASFTGDRTHLDEFYRVLEGIRPE